MKPSKPSKPSTRARFSQPATRRDMMAFGRQVAGDAYALTALIVRSLARALAGNRLLLILLLCGAVWLAHNPGSALRGLLDAGAPIARLLGLGESPSGSCQPDQVRPCGDHVIYDDRVRHAVAPNPNGEIVHVPSIGVRAIWQALWEAGSPLADDTPRRDGRTYAQYIWDAGRASGVDPAVFMGVFNVESKYGREGVARYTYSPGNIRAVGGQASFQGYASYPDWFAGIDATYALLRSYVERGLPTVETAIPVWAPSSDHNDPLLYIALIKNTMASLAAPTG